MGDVHGDLIESWDYQGISWEKDGEHPQWRFQWRKSTRGTNNLTINGM